MFVHDVFLMTWWYKNSAISMKINLKEYFVSFQSFICIICVVCFSMDAIRMQKKNHVDRIWIYFLECETGLEAKPSNPFSFLYKDLYGKIQICIRKME